MKRLFTLLLIACSTIATMSADPSVAPQKKPELVIFTLNAITQKFGQNEGQVYSVNRNPNTGIIESSIKIVPFRCKANHIQNDNVLNAVAINFPKNEPLAYQFLHVQPGSNEMFSLKVITNNGTNQSTQRIRTNKNQEMWLMCCKNPENPQLRDAYAIVWESDGVDVDGTVYMISSLRPDIYEKELASSKKTFKIVGRVDENIKDSLYNIYIAESAEELEAIGDDDYVACVPVINKRFEWQTELEKPMVGRLRCIFPDGELCSAWINLDFVPGETYNITVHNGYYDGDQDYERRVGRYSGKSLLNRSQIRGNDDVVVVEDYDRDSWEEVDTVPGYNEGDVYPGLVRERFLPTPKQQMQFENQTTAIKGNMDAIKATYSSLEPFVKMGSLTGSDNYFKQIIGLNKELDVKFQNYIKFWKGIDGIPSDWKNMVYEGILRFYSEQSQGYGELYKKVGVLPKSAKEAQKHVNQLMEKYMREMGKAMMEPEH